MIPFQEVKVLDINAEHAGIPQETLMENAGRGVAVAVEERYGSGMRICVVCGTGNNAGDGFVAARYLSEKNEVFLALVKGEKGIRTSLARKNYYRVKRLVSGYIDNPESLKEFDVIVDALLGIGISGRVREPYGAWIEAINSSGKKVVSIDIPSGLGTDISVRPDMTVTFQEMKYGMDPENCGKIKVVDIGIPEDAIKYVGPGEFVYYPVPRRDAHKGDSGRVLIIGGGPYTGAPVLAGMAAYRAGADLVHIAAPEMAARAAINAMTEFIVHPFEGEHFTPAHVPALLDLADGMDSLVIGPGLGRDSETVEAIRTVLERIGDKKKIVIDADGLYILSVMNDEVLKGNISLAGVITPHSREFFRLRYYDGRRPALEDVEGLARDTKMTVLLKGPEDIISDGERSKYNRTGNPAMTVGGTGDVLAGITGALLGKGVLPFDAARLAAFISGAAGDFAFERQSYGLVASDVVQEIPRVLRTYLKE